MRVASDRSAPAVISTVIAIRCRLSGGVLNGVPSSFSADKTKTKNNVGLASGDRTRETVSCESCYPTTQGGLS